MAYSPDPDRRTPLPKGAWLGFAVLLAATVAAVGVFPVVVTACLAVIAGA